MKQAPSGHERWMRAAMRGAIRAAERGEVPVGAVIVRGGRVIASGGNRSIGASDPTAHAEIVALRRAARKDKNYRLSGAVMYATVEPCAMCAGALVWARVDEIVYGAPDSKAGACGSIMDVPGNPRHNHRIKVTGGVLADECAAVMKKFFSERRKVPRTARLKRT